MLSADGLRFSYESGRPLFADLSFQVLEGQSCAIFGPSGVGKSTLLAVVGGLLAPDAGSVTFDGRPLGADRAVAIGAWVTQHLHLFPARTVLDNAIAQGLIDGDSPTSLRRRAGPVLESLGIHDRACDRARVLSGGERQRLVVARALISRRRLLLVDEPTSQLDRKLARDAIACLMSAVHSDRLALIVTHDDELADACDLKVSLG